MFLLTHLCRMYFPILINWTSPFPILGLLGGIFHFYSNFKRNFCLQTVENLIRRDVWSGFALFADVLQKKNAGLIMVKAKEQNHKMDIQHDSCSYRICANASSQCSSRCVKRSRYLNVILSHTNEGCWICTFTQPCLSNAKNTKSLCVGSILLVNASTKDNF